MLEELIGPGASAHVTDCTTVSSRRIGQPLTARPAGDIKRALQRYGSWRWSGRTHLVYYVVVLDFAKRVEANNRHSGFSAVLSACIVG